MWKRLVIDDIELPYEVHEKGKVRRIETGRILKNYVHEDGYRHVCIRSAKHNFNKCIYLHRLVAMTFIPNPRNLTQVNHIDCDKANNCAENLEWCDGKHNMRHAYANGLCERGEKHGMSKHTDEQIRDVCCLLEEGEMTQERISRMTGVSIGTVNNVFHRKNWTHISDDYTFPYKTNRSPSEKYYNSVDKAILESAPRQDVIKALERKGLTHSCAESTYDRRQQVVKHHKSPVQCTVYIDDGEEIF